MWSAATDARPSSAFTGPDQHGNVATDFVAPERISKAARAGFTRHAEKLQEPCRPQHRAPHMRRWARIEAEPFFRLFEIATDDVSEFVKLDPGIGVE